MIPQFPKIRKLSISDKKWVEKYTRLYPPYSDYNFSSLWAWNIEGNILVSVLNGNLVMRFDDYMTRIPRYSLLGTNKVNQSVYILLERSVREGLAPILKLVPEITIKSLHWSPKERFIIKEDRDQFDYIYSTKELVALRGGEYAEKRHFVNRFKKLHQSAHTIIDLTNPLVKKEILAISLAWAESRNKNLQEIQPEFSAIEVALDYVDHLNLLGVGLFVNNKMIGFSINDITHKEYAETIFEKADVRFEGVFPYLRHITCLYLSYQKYRFLNFESDMGISGLRKSKLSFNPKFFLKKYIIYQTGYRP